MPAEKEKRGKEDKSKVHKLSLKGESPDCERAVCSVARSLKTEKRRSSENLDFLIRW